MSTSLRLSTLCFRRKPQAIQFEASNPRHQHEWQTWAEADIPDDKILIPGALDTTTNFIEHPQLVAERIERFADRRQGERVIAGTDCGFGTFAGFGAIHPDIAYAKLNSLAEGARIASERLWSLTPGGNRRGDIPCPSLASPLSNP